MQLCKVYCIPECLLNGVKEVFEALELHNVKSKISVLKKEICSKDACGMNKMCGDVSGVIDTAAEWSLMRCKCKTVYKQKKIAY